MIGIDTNILVRYLVRDDLSQAAEASKIIEGKRASQEGIFLNILVLCELVWVLESAYECNKSTILALLKKVLSTKQFEIEGRTLVWRAVDWYANSKVDFSDTLIGLINTRRECTTTYTFDKSLKRLPAFSVL